MILNLNIEKVMKELKKPLKILKRDYQMMSH